MPKKASPKGFARVDSESTNTHGWLVRILRGAERRSKFFSDKSHGGKTKAKKKAEECYQAWAAEMAPPSSTRDKVTKRNATGAVGVHLATETDARYPDCQYISYVASWMLEGGKRRNIRFLVSKYGKKTALALAKLAREKQLADRDKVHALYEKQIGPLKLAAKSISGAKKLSSAAKKPTNAAKKATITASKPSSAAKKSTPATRPAAAKSRPNVSARTADARKSLAKKQVPKKSLSSR